MRIYALSTIRNRGPYLALYFLGLALAFTNNRTIQPSNNSKGFLLDLYCEIMDIGCRGYRKRKIQTKDLQGGL